MPNLITINDTQIEQLTYHDQPVVTFEMIAQVHGVPNQNVQKSFYRHQGRFTEGKHYYRIDTTESERSVLGVRTGQHGAILFTRKGYLLLVKPMKDEQSWQVQEQMIDEYFALQDARQSPALPVIHDPAMGMLIDMAYKHDAALHEIACLKTEQERQDKALITFQTQTIEALTTSQQAKTNTEIILDRYRMTLEQFVGAQGLLRIIPPTTFKSASAWLGAYCVTQGWDAPQLPVQGRPWMTEKSYPVEALMRYVEYLGKRPQQISLVNRSHTGA